MGERILDVRGKPCPQPVIDARRILLEASPEVLRVIVSDPASAENVGRMARSLGKVVRTEQPQAGEIHLIITPGAAETGRQPVDGPRAAASAPTAAPAPDEAAASYGCTPQNVVLVTSAEFGSGDPELGALLLRSFLKTLKEVAPRPRAIIFVNGGVRLTTNGSPLLDEMRELEGLGVRVLSCGTCLDFFHLKAALRVGTVTNMFEIVSLLSTADRVIRP